MAANSRTVDEMGCSRELLQRATALNRGMRDAGDERVWRLEERASVQRLVDGQEEANRQVNAAFGHHPIGLANIALAGLDLHAGRLTPYHFQQ